MKDHIKYEIIHLPIDYTKSFLNLNSKEIHEYFDWFLKIKNKRKELFCEYLFSNKENCISEGNLKAIEIFLNDNVSVVEKTTNELNSEKEVIPDRLKPFVKLENKKLSENTISICYDLGIFMGELIISMDKEIKWTIEANKRFADYGQPIIVKKDCKLSLNPFRVAKNIAARIADGTNKEGGLLEAFSAWKEGFGVE